MLRRALLLPLAFMLLLPLLPAGAGAATLRFDGARALDWSRPATHFLQIPVRGDLRTLLRIRLVTVELVVLPSGRIVTRRIALVPFRPEPPAQPDPGLVVLPLPAAMPMLLAALAGFAIVGRRRRRGPALAGPQRSA